VKKNIENTTWQDQFLSEAGIFKSLIAIFTIFQGGINLVGCFSHKKNSLGKQITKRNRQKYVDFSKIGRNRRFLANLGCAFSA